LDYFNQEEILHILTLIDAAFCLKEEAISSATVTCTVNESSSNMSRRVHVTLPLVDHRLSWQCYSRWRPRVFVQATFRASFTVVCGTFHGQDNAKHGRLQSTTTLLWTTAYMLQ